MPVLPVREMRQVRLFPDPRGLLVLLAGLGVALVPIVSPTAGAVAQAGPARQGQAPAPGTRLRLHLANYPDQIAAGRYSGADRDSLSLRAADGAEARFGWDEITTVERYDGARGHALVGAAIGAGAGMVAWALATRQIEVGESSFQTLGGVFLTAGLGAGIGALIGGMTRSERWTVVPLWGPTGGAGLGAAVTLGPQPKEHR